MSVIYNGTTVTKVYYNNTEADSLTWNGTKVGDFGAPYKKHLSSSSISITDFLNDVLTEDNAVFNDNQASQFIGKTITGITNTYDSSSNVDWEIIDYNHDESNNTFDLIAKSSVKDSKMFRNDNNGGGTKFNQNYEYSEIRTWLQNYVNNFSSPLSTTRLAIMDIIYNFNTYESGAQLFTYSGRVDSNTNTTGNNKHTIQDKIKLLSCTELGYSGSGISYMPNDEGNIYSNKFNSFNSNVSDNNRIRNDTSGSATNWWLRSRSAEYASSVYFIKKDGLFSSNDTNANYSVIPVIRLKYLKPYELYLSDSSISITDFLNNVINDASVFTDNQASQFVGKTITGINNTQGNTTDWTIADYNHDGSSNTFDLVSNKTVKDSIAFYAAANHSSIGGDYLYNQNYEFSDIRSWFSNTYYDGFSSELKAKMTTMDVVYNFNTKQPSNQCYSNTSTFVDSGTTTHTLTDKIKILSTTELGYTTSAHIYLPQVAEGNRYPIYSSKTGIGGSSNFDDNMYKYSGYNNAVSTWPTRSRYINNSDYVWAVNSNNSTISRYTTNGSGVAVAVIRLTV